MRHCPRCSTAYPDDVAACPLDGASLSSAPRPDPLLNRIIKGRYRIVGRLGDGGMGAVYRAEQLSVGRMVALKILHREFARDEEFVQRFHQEARLAAALNHPRLTTVFDFDQSEDGTLFIVMEYLEGTRLSDLIRRAGPLELARAVGLGIQVAEGLEAAHAAGVIHRDVKPQNIMVLASGDVKLMDFGIARLNDGRDVQLTRAGTMMGTPLYMAPEQIEGGAVSEKTDIYAFGVVLYEMLSGQTPFSAPTSAAVFAKQLSEPVRPLRALRPDVPPLLEQIVMQALEKDPEYRQERAAEIVRRLRAVPGVPVSAHGETLVSSARTVVGSTRSPVPGHEPGAETILAGSTMAPGRRSDEAGTIVGGPVPPAPRKSRWSRLTEGYGKLIVVAAIVVIGGGIAAIPLWRMIHPAIPPPPEISRSPEPIPPAPELRPAPPQPPQVIPQTPSTPPPLPPSQPRPNPPTPSAKPTPSLKPVPAVDGPRPLTIKASVERELKAAGLLRSSPDSDEPGVEVEVIETDGHVKLKGVLRNAAEIQKARALALAIEGVKEVSVDRVNRLWSGESR